MISNTFYLLIIKPMMRLLGLVSLIFSVLGYYVEVEDTVGQREAVVWGVLKLIHYQQDRKQALILEGGFLEHLRGEPPLTIDDIDIMHPIDGHIHRFEPEFMRPLNIKNKKNQMEMLAYESEKDPRWHYRLHIAPQLTDQIQQIRTFIQNHHTEDQIDLFQKVPEDLREQLEREHQAALQQLQRRQQQAIFQSQNGSAEL